MSNSNEIYSQIDELVSDRLKTFDDYAITETAEELLAKLEDERFFLEPLALEGQMTMIYAPPNAGKTLIILYLAREYAWKNLSTT